MYTVSVIYAQLILVYTYMHLYICMLYIFTYIFVDVSFDMYIYKHIYAYMWHIHTQAHIPVYSRTHSQLEIIIDLPIGFQINNIISHSQHCQRLGAGVRRALNPQVSPRHRCCLFHHLTQDKRSTAWVYCFLSAGKYQTIDLIRDL